MRPGGPTAAVALHHGLNAYMLRKWVINAELKRPASSQPAPMASMASMAAEEPEPAAAPAFVPLALPAPAAAGDIRTALQRAGATVTI